MPQRNYNLLRKGNAMREIDSLAILVSKHRSSLLPINCSFCYSIPCSAAQADPSPKITGQDGSFAWVLKSTPALS